MQPGKIFRFYAIFMSLLITTGCNIQTNQSLNQNDQLQSIITEIVEKDNSIYNCTISILGGDGSISWSGSAGIANLEQSIPMTNHTPFFIASITKMYTATVIMQLYEEGDISLDDPMASYLPAELIEGIHIYKGIDYSQTISIRQLLSHTSGIADYYSQKPPKKNPKKKRSLYEEFLKNPERVWTVEETIAQARDNLQPNFIPGTKGSYSDTNYQLLGKIIETVTGKPLYRVYEDRIFKPLKLKHTWLINYSQPIEKPKMSIADIYENKQIVTKVRYNGSYWADGGIISTTEDCILFLKALREEKLISTETLEMMHQWGKIDFPLQYGFGTMYFNLPKHMNNITHLPTLWGHSGSTGSFLYYCEDNDLYFAGTINQTTSKMEPFFLIRDIMIEITQKNE